MKNRLTFSLIIMMLFVIACKQIDIQEDLFPVAKQDMKDLKRSQYDIGLKTATYTARFLSSKLVTSIEPIVNGADTLMFVINYKDGWLVLSGDKRTVPILGNSINGSFKSAIENPGSAIWLNQAANEILNLKRSNPQIDKKRLAQSKDYDFWVKMERAANLQNYAKLNMLPYYGDDEENVTVYLCKRLLSSSCVNEREIRVGPLLTTNWGQSEPWNVNLPFVRTNDSYKKALVGCAAVAVGQILYFTHFKFNAPSGLYHNISSTGIIYDDENYNTSFHRSDYVDNSPRWEQMALNSWQSNTSYVADFLADVGNRLNMKYEADGSAADITTDALRHYGIIFDKKDYDASKVIESIRGGMPVIMTAYAKKNTTNWLFFKSTHYSQGHAWVVDGIVDKIRTMNYDYIWEIVYVPNNQKGPYDIVDPYFPTQELPINSLDKLYMQYDEVLPIDEANRQGLYDGKLETQSFESTSTYLVMNWGWNGSENSQQYSPYTTVWSADQYNFEYKKEMFYNIRKTN